MSAPEPGSFVELERVLAARVDFERTPPAHGFELARVRALAEALGDPGAALPAVHVAGTTGKGTLTALVACAASLAGLETGWTTSPHLCNLRERIRVGPGPLSDAGWCRALGEVLRAEERAQEAGSGHEPATFFELVILSALAAFRAAELDLSVVEVGLGGRLDATRAVRPSVSVITRIGLDHRELLGDDEASVAREKAGILVPGVPLVAGPDHAEAEAAISARAEALGCPTWWLGRELDVVGGRLRVPGRELVLPDLSGNPVRRPAAALAGGVLLRLEQLTGRRDLLSALPEALERLRWRGRCEWIAGNPPLLLDGAHDGPSAQALSQAYRARAGETSGGLLLAVARGKDLDGIVQALSPLAERAWACAAHGPSRALDPQVLAAKLESAGVATEVCSSPVAALERARAWAEACGRPLVASGSLYLVGAVLGALGLDADAAW